MSEMRDRAIVILFKPTGKYYTEEEWIIPTQEEIDAASPPQPSSFSEGKVSAAYPFIPYCMRFSPDFRRIAGGAVLVPTQEPWGYPHLIPGEAE